MIKFMKGIMMKQKIIKIFTKGNDTDVRVLKAFIYSFVGAIISKGLIVFTGIILSRILGNEEYGKYSLINSTIQTFVTFASMGIGATMVRYVAIYRNKEKNTCGKYIGTFLIVIILMSLAISLIVYAFSDIISLWTVESNELSYLYHIASFIILFVAISSALQSILIGFESFKSISMYEIAYGLISIVIVYFFSIKYGLVGALYGLLLSRIVYSIILFYSSKRISKSCHIKWKIKFDKQIINSYIKFTFPSFI